MQNLYVIYGRNLNRERMLQCCPTANPMAVATLHDYQLVFQDSTHGVRANIIPMKGQEVPVVIWELSEDDEVHLDVDEWLGYGGCTKEYVDVEVDGETLQAQVYILPPGPFGTPSDRYLQYMAEGYRDFDLPALALNEAVSRAYENEIINGAVISTHEDTVQRPLL